MGCMQCMHVMHVLYAMRVRTHVRVCACAMSCVVKNMHNFQSGFANVLKRPPNSTFSIFVILITTHKSKHILSSDPYFLKREFLIMKCIVGVYVCVHVCMSACMHVCS